MRADYLRHLLLEMPSATVAELVLLVVSGAETRDQRYTDLLQVFSLSMADPSCSDLRADVGGLLRACEQQDMATLIDAAEPSDDDQEPLPVPDFGRGRPLTLGERKSLARRRDRDLLARVLRDPHPDVIAILLENPALTETDVQRLCARRPVPREVLRQVFRSARWVARYKVKLALAQNPYAPLDVRMQLAPQLSRPDLMRLRRGEQLPGPLAESCRRMTEKATVH